jgi:hypothetical protein
MSKLLSLLVVGAVLALSIWLRPEHEGRLAGPPQSPVYADTTRLDSPDADASRPEALAAVESELAETGRVVRRRAARLQASSQLTDDELTTAAIERQLERDPRLRAMSIEVNTVDGRVTLAGRVGSAGEVLRAIEIAFDNNSVRQVISTLQIAPPTARVERPTLPR